MPRNRDWRILTALLAATQTALAAQHIDTEQLTARGVTFYAPFEGSATATYARGNPEPVYLCNPHWTDGKFGRAVLTMKGREAQLGKLKGRATGINYDATGHLYGERGTLAYWVQPQYDADDPTIRSGSNSTGPYLVNVSSVEDTYYNQFIRSNIKGGAFYFWVVDRDGDQHGFSYGQGIRNWKAGRWHHIVLTWDANRGMRFYDNGQLKYSTWNGDAFPPATPDTIGVGCSRPTSRPAWTTAADAAFDELIMLDRAVAEREVAALMDGRYADLAPRRALHYTDQQLADRRKKLKIEPDPSRIQFTSDGSRIAASIRQIDPLSIETRFIESGHLADGRWQPTVRFAQGGLTMPRKVTFRLPQESTANYAVIAGKPPEGDSFHIAGVERDLETTAAAAARVALPDADAIELHVPAAGEVGETIAYDIAQPDELPALSTHWRLGRRASPRDLASPNTAPPDIKAEQDDYADIVTPITSQSDRLLARLDPADRTLLLPGDGPAADVTVPPTRHLTLAGPRLQKHASVRALRLRFPIQPHSRQQVLRVTVPHPYEPNAFYLTVDLNLRWTGTSPQTLDLQIACPGMIFPKGSRPLLEIVSSTGFALAAAPELYADLGSAHREGEAFARQYLRLINRQFAARMGQNFKFYYRGIEPDNPLTRALYRILTFDPDNPEALDLLHWARIEPWPDFDRPPAGPDHFPALAKCAREAAMAAGDTIHWWIDNRQDKTGYMVGRANRWNDDTKLFNEYSFLWLLSGDDKLASAMEKYLDAHWASGRMENGWSKPWTDIVHSAEEASYLQPTMALVRYGDPIHLERLMRTASNIDYWTGINDRGHRHFKSNFFTADKMKTEGHFGHDVGLNATAMTASMYLAWYSRHPVATRQFTEWVRAWVEDSMKKTEDKQAGRIPSWIDFDTGEIGPDRGVYPAEIAMMMNAAYQLTGNRSFLQPLQHYIDIKHGRWEKYLKMAAPDLCRALPESDYRDLLLAYAEEGMDYVSDDSFFQRGLFYQELPGIIGWLITGDREYLERTAFHAWRNNSRAKRIYTQVDPHKDRVYSWGRYVLPWMYCGGNALNARGSGPWPTIAVSWTDTGFDFAAFVNRASRDSIAVKAWNFANTRTVGMRTWNLAPGRYRLRVTGEDGVSRSREVDIERGRAVPIDLPAGGAVAAELTLVDPGDWSPQRPDLALSASEGAQLDNGELTVTVHNIGSVDAPACRAAVYSDGEMGAHADVPPIPAPIDFKPKRAQVRFQLPHNIHSDARILIDADNTVPEITEFNNGLSLHLPRE